MAFCLWRCEGSTLYNNDGSGELGRCRKGDEIDGVDYHKVNDKDILSGWATVAIRVDNNGNEYQARMVDFKYSQRQL